MQGSAAERYSPVVTITRFSKHPLVKKDLVTIMDDGGLRIDPAHRRGVNHYLWRMQGQSRMEVGWFEASSHVFVVEQGLPSGELYIECSCPGVEEAHQPLILCDSGRFLGYLMGHNLPVYIGPLSRKLGENRG